MWKLRHFRKLSQSVTALAPKKPFYVTTPIFYVNAAPHIGHLYSAVIADAICRYERLRCTEATADGVRLCTGTDEHGSKIQQAAAQHKVPLEKYCSDISARYRHVFHEANIQYTDFIRTTEQRHKQAVAAFWANLKSKGFIYASEYSGWYCMSDETFLTDSQLRLDESSGVRYSLESGHPVEWTNERNYMFRLNSVQDDLLHWLRSGNRIRPKLFEKPLLAMLSEPLQDVSVSRPISRVHWAIPVPDDATQSVYVWLDALVNYLTSAGYPNEEYRNTWPPNVQVIGKDILKFHGIYWPAFLIAAGLEPPHELFVHSHWTVDDQKMSKSKGNVVDPLEAAKVYTMEGLRYFLLREGVAHNDGNYSNTKALRILNSELADTLGNLLSRACAKSLNVQQVYPRVHAAHLQAILQTDAAQRLNEALQQLSVNCEQHYGDRNFYMVVDCVMATLHAANNFFESLRPWELKAKRQADSNNNNNSKNAQMSTQQQDQQQLHSQSRISDADENAARLETIIAMTMDTLKLCGIVLQPIVPHLSAQLLDRLNVPHERRLWQHLCESFVYVNVSRPANERQQQLGKANTILFQRIQLAEDDSSNNNSNNNKRRRSIAEKPK